MIYRVHTLHHGRYRRMTRLTSTAAEGPNMTLRSFVVLHDHSALGPTEPAPTLRPGIGGATRRPSESHPTIRPRTGQGNQRANRRVAPRRRERSGEKNVCAVPNGTASVKDTGRKRNSQERDVGTVSITMRSACTSHISRIRGRSCPCQNGSFPPSSQWYLLQSMSICRNMSATLATEVCARSCWVSSICTYQSRT
ncbi:hypothetical protein OBBRIDRAFT_524024 [Obba rivulosa]|uniref:Uncharacterized protein n=1 Tax=Obba rivulosa TaxID=1052685 RepID=A0A8E2DKF5_9APHY|nr:hypothetical protein OBBRIDRAFT_524024 [Obba rivulosa]